MAAHSDVARYPATIVEIRPFQLISWTATKNHKVENSILKASKNSENIRFPNLIILPNIKAM